MNRSFVAKALLSLAATVLLGLPVKAQALMLTYASNGPEQSVRGAAEKAFLDALETESKGAIKVQAFWSDSLVSGQEMLKSIQDGTVDMGFINAFFFPKRLPFTNSIALTEFGPTSGGDMVKLYRELYQTVPVLMEEFLVNGQRPVYFFATDSYSFVSTKPLTRVEDLKGVKARSSSRWKLADFKAVGATPVSVAWSECYMALQTGTIQSVMTSLESQARGRLYEVAPNLWVWDKMWTAVPYIISMNDKKFQSLTPEQKAVFERAMEKASQAFAQQFDADVKAGIALMEKAGTKVTYATKDDYDKWNALPSVEGNRKIWLEEAKSAGLKSPEEHLQKITETVSRYTK